MVSVKRSRFLRTDFKRCFTSKEFIIGVVGVYLVLLWGIISSGTLEGDTVLYSVYWSTFGVQFLLTMVFCAVSYAGSFCEDLEYLFLRQILLREKSMPYCIIRSAVIFLAGIVTFLVGIFFFVCSLRLFMPWVKTDDSVYMAAIQGSSFHMLLKNGHYFTWFLFSSLQYSILMGILSLAAAYFSLFFKNKLLTYAIPVIVYYFTTRFLGKATASDLRFDLNAIFAYNGNLFGDDLLSFCYAILWGLAAWLLLTILIYRKVGRLVENAL